MGFVQEFKEFAIKGNVMDLAIGVVIGAAFGKIVTALVADIVMPPVSVILSKGGGDWRTLTWHTIKIGDFAGTILDFLIIATAIFLVVKGINALKKQEAAAPAPVEPSSTDKLLMEIRDSLKK
jgi:large conductance mechanosensitive channel